MDPPAFGRPMREEFRMSPDFTQLNQGSYGTVPKRIQQKLREVEDTHDSDFNVWFRTERFEQIPAEKAKVASFLGMNPEDFSFVENATRGINNVMKRLSWAEGDAILYNNWTYGATWEIIHDIMAANKGVSEVRMAHQYPVESEQQVLQQYEQVLQENPKIKLCVVDHISSGPALLFPVAAITALCHQHDVQVLIDGAHCPGHVPLDISSIGADYYIGNLHKWAFSARGVAFQWVRPDHHGAIFPAVTSFDATKPFPDNTFNQGTRNDAPYMTAGAALDFYQWIGGLSAIQSYCSPMLEAAANRMAEEFGTRRLEIPSSMEAPLLLQVILPDLPGFDMTNPTAMTTYIRDVYSIWVAVVYMNEFGTTILRLSGSIFNEPADYDRLTAAIVEMMNGKLNKDALENAQRKAALYSHL